MMKRKIMFFHATWCRPCMRMKQNVFPEVIEQCPGQVDMVDIDQTPGKCDRWKVYRVPEIIFLDENGSERARRRMLLESDTLIDWLKGEIGIDDIG